MTRWIVKSGDILAEQAEILICSANVFLNLSGGVGGEILLRHGSEMQHQLHAYLQQRGIRHVERGDVIVTSGCGTSFKTVLHAVAVDGFYQSSTPVITTVVESALLKAATSGAKTVALTALATGFGRLSFAQFGSGLTPLIQRDFPPIERISVCVRRPDEAVAIRASIGAGM